MKRIYHNILMLLVIAIVMAGCSDMHDPELHAMGKVEIRPAIEQDIDIDLMWQTDWKTRWQVDWDTEKLGTLGYTEPSTFHLDYYKGADGSWLGERNVAGNSIRVSLAYGTYHLLAYNNDFQDIRIADGKRTTKNPTKVITNSVVAYTDRDRYAVLTDSLSKVLTVNQMPDQIFSAYATDIVVSDRLEDYIFIPEENIYLLRLNATLQPRVFIYLVQVELLHNNGRINNSGALTVDGLAESVDLLTTEPNANSVAHQFASIFQDKAKVAANTKGESGHIGEDRTLIGGRLTTFGRTANSTNKCYITLYYANGGLLVVPVDITDQMKALPKGGVINIMLDVDKLGGPKSGWDMNVGDWDEENHYQGV